MERDSEDYTPRYGESATFWPVAIAYGGRDTGEVFSNSFLCVSISLYGSPPFPRAKGFVLGREENGQETQGLLCVCAYVWLGVCVFLSV